MLPPPSSKPWRNVPRFSTDLYALRAGSAADDSADALAARQFRIVLGAAAELDQLVIVAAPSFGDPGTEVLSQRLDHLVLVGAARRTTRRSYEAAIGNLSDRYATLFGTVLLEGRSGRTRTRRSTPRKPKATREQLAGGPPQSPSIVQPGKNPNPGR